MAPCTGTSVLYNFWRHCKQASNFESSQEALSRSAQQLSWVPLQRSDRWLKGQCAWGLPLCASITELQEPGACMHREDEF